MSNPTEEFSIGERVRISDSYHWAKNVLGTIKQPPKEIAQFLEGWAGHKKEVKSLRGFIVFYWVEFDEPQIDADGDGAYFAGAIESDFLIHLISDNK